ncbi:MAG TPA: FAD binding domain-containing protein [Thermoanaerobaculia bacterium]
MMRAGEFRYHPARSLDDAARALADGGPQAVLLAGGTDLIPNMKRRQQTPELLVGLRGVGELRGISYDGELTIGASTTLADLVRDRRIAETHNALFRAAAQIATPLVRNSATLGGNLSIDTRCNYYNQNYDWREAIGFCKKAPAPRGTAVEQPSDRDVCWVAPSSPRCWAVSSSDAAPALIALGARVTLTSVRGEREIALELLYCDDGMQFMAREPDEILAAIRVPLAPRRSTYWKLRRRGSFDFPVLGVAASVQLTPNGVVDSARIVLGAVASRPLLLAESDLLVGKPLTDDSIEQFAESAARHAKPLDNTDLQMTWRKKVAQSYLAGALRELRGDDPSTFPLLAREASRTLTPTW